MTVVSSSRWATRHHTDFLPASPARDSSAYQLFLGALVSRCAGRVTYWQCSNEPSNAGLWSGTADEYAEQAVTFARVVRLIDPRAKLVLGGCGHDVLSAPAGAAPRTFFETVLDKAGDAYDLFAVHLYGDPTRIPAHIEDVRQMMRAHGGERPVVIGEYGGPTLLGFPALEPVLQRVMIEAFSGGAPSLDSADLAAATETPDRRAMRMLYERMAEQPPELQMFMQGCPPLLEARRHRIACREVVTRNLLALASGVTRTLCWNLAPEVPNYRDKLNLMGFLSDKLALLDYVNGTLSKREPAADAFARLAAFLDGAVSVWRLEAGPGVIAIEVVRERGVLHVLWVEGDAFAGEDEAPRLVDWPWPHETARAIDVFGMAHPLTPTGQRINLALSVTPLFVEP